MTPSTIRARGPALAIHPAVDRRLRRRRRAAFVLVVLSSIAVAASAVAIWSHRVVFDTDTWVDVADSVADDPAVRGAVSLAIADAVRDASGIETRLQDALPDRARPLAIPIGGALRDLISKQVDEVLATPKAREAWREVNRLAHSQLIAALEGDSRSVHLDEDGISLDLLPLIGLTLQRLEARMPGIVTHAEALAAIGTTTPRDRVVAAIERATGRSLTTDFGTIVVLRGNQGAQAQRALGAFDTVVKVVVGFTAVLAAIAIAISPRRRWTVFQLGVGMIVAVVVIRVALRQVDSATVASADADRADVLVRAFVRAALDDLNESTGLLLAAGAVVAIVAFAATMLPSLRQQWQTLVGANPRNREGSLPGPTWHRRVVAHAESLSAAGLAVGIVVMLLLVDSWPWALLVGVGLIAYVVALRVLAAKEHSHGPE